MPQTPLDSYLALVRATKLEADLAQLAAAHKLDSLDRELRRWRPASMWWPLFPSTAAPRGLYVYGPVGRGKTLLMDLFYGATRFQPRRRVHFHAFMAEVHDRIGAARKSMAGDPIPVVGQQIAQEARLLCFDELHVTDIADAMILGRLFKSLFAAGVVVVATTNTPLHDLYRDGLNRQLFLPFIALIERHMDVHQLAAAKDFRLDKLAGHPLYFTPADDRAHRAIRAAFERLTGQMKGDSRVLLVKGHKLRIPESAMGVARFGFSDLCEQPIGALDYLHIAQTFHTVLVEQIPRFSPTRREVARRFINLIDTLYDKRIGFVASAEAEPHELCTEGDLAVLFERTASRLIEMRSNSYLGGRGEVIARMST